MTRVGGGQIDLGVITYWESYAKRCGIDLEYEEDGGEPNEGQFESQ